MPTTKRGRKKTKSHTGSCHQEHQSNPYWYHGLQEHLEHSVYPWRTGTDQRTGHHAIEPHLVTPHNTRRQIIEMVRTFNLHVTTSLRLKISASDDTVILAVTNATAPEGLRSKR
jgi:hypothetical protein